MGKVVFKNFPDKGAHKNIQSYPHVLGLLKLWTTWYAIKTLKHSLLKKENLENERSN